MKKRGSSFSDFDIPNEKDTKQITARTIIKSFLNSITPSKSLNFQSKKNYRELVALLTMGHKQFPCVLVVGGRKLGTGMTALTENETVYLVDTDIQFGPRTQLVCDAHSLPFENNSFDAVIIQAVLEHVVEPTLCVEEIHRVLVDGGLVYAETPFLQEVHEFPYDFTRFTYLGHRRLFRKFEQIDSGAIAGPGTALAWAWESFWCSFSDNVRIKGLMRRLARFSGFWVKYLDFFILKNKGILECASAYYFLGKKTGKTLSDKELVVFDA